MSSDIELLHNKGVFVINQPAEPAAEKTIIVLGAARGGTSMAAGALHHLGVCMGDDVSVVYEDLALSTAIEQGDVSAAEAVIAKRNKAYPVWGWKRPSSIKFGEKWKDRFRNPYYVVVFRDVFAIANRNRISMMASVITNMRASLAHYGAILDFLQESKAPCLLVSYEKAMGEREYFVRQLRDFVGTGDESQISAAIDFIEPHPETYLKVSRITDGVGVVDKVRTNVVSGWAMFKKSPRAAEVALRINGEEVMAMRAKRLRKDLLDKGLHPTGQCGFMFKLPSGKELQPGDQVSVRVVGDIADLHNSPAIYTGEDPVEPNKPKGQAGAT